MVILATWLNTYDELEVNERIHLAEALTESARYQEAALELQYLEGVALCREDQLALDGLAKRISRPRTPISSSIPIILSTTTRQQFAARVSPSHQPITMLVGESGVGKSKLLDWMTRLAAVRGAKVFAHSIISAVPTQGIGSVLRLMETLNVSWGKGSSGANIASLAGETADRIGQQWAFIAVDNINHADHAMREFLRLLPAMSKTGTIKVVCATSGDPTREQSAWATSLLPNIDIVRLDPLNDHDSAALLDRFVLANCFALTDSERRTIVDQSRGIPRRILRMAEAFAEGSEGFPRLWELDGSVAQRVITQIETLSETELLVLGCMVLSTACLDPPAIATVLGLTQEQVGRAVGVLAEHSLLARHMHGASSEPHVSSAFCAIAPPTVQNDIRSSLAAYYSSKEEYLAAAECYDEAGHRHAAGVHYELAAIHAMRSGLFDAVEKSCKAALARSATAEEYQSRSRLLASYYCRISRWEHAYPHLLCLTRRTPDEELALLTSGLAFVEGSSDSAWKDITQRISDLQARGVDQATVARTYLVAFDRAYQFGKEDVVLPGFQQFLAERQPSDPRGLAEVLMKSARINQLFGNPSMALSEATEAVDIANELNDPVVLSNAFDTRALVRQLKGDVSGAFLDFEESERVADSAALYFLRERYYNNLAVLYYETGELVDARRLLRTAALFSSDTQLYALANLGVVELADENYDLAKAYGLKLRSLSSVTYSTIGLTICGIADMAAGDLSSAQQIFWNLYRRTNSFRLQLTDPSYTLSFAAECGPAVGIDPVPHVRRAISKVADRNIYAFLRLRLALARSLMGGYPAQAREICRGIVTAARATSATPIHAQAEALLAAL